MCAVVAQLQMWLQALYEVEPDCRVVLVATHADRVPTDRLSDVWRRLVDGLLDPARPHHVLRTAAATSASRRRCSCANCLLCRPKYLAVRHADDPRAARPPSRAARAPSTDQVPRRPARRRHGRHRHIRSLAVRSSADTGCTAPVPLAVRHAADDSAGTASPLDSGSLARGSSSCASPAAAQRATGFVDLSLPVGNGAVKANATNGHVSSGGERPAARALRFPHIVGYYETDATATASSRANREKDPSSVLYENTRH